MTDELLSIWTIYDHPRDYPQFFVARRWEVGLGVERATEDAIFGTALNQVRSILLERYPDLYRLPRFRIDDPKIVECWL